MAFSRARDRLAGASFDSRTIARLTRRTHVVVLGDSHAAVLSEWRPPGWRFDVTSVGGATASGIRNPNSATEALPRFRARLERIRRFQPAMVVLGEVDCGYIIWKRATDGGPLLEQVLDDTIKRYTQFLAEVDGSSRAGVLVLSVPLPTLPDDASAWGEVARRRSDIAVPMHERTALTLRFNEMLQAACAAAGYRFVDSTTGQLDGYSGLIRNDLIRHGSGDHHLEDGPFKSLIAEALAG